MLVHLDEDLVDRLAELAAAEGTTPSELLRRAAHALVDAADQRDANTRG
jgi:predicted transcriptional regulator